MHRYIISAILLVLLLATGCNLADSTPPSSSSDDAGDGSTGGDSAVDSVTTDDSTDPQDSIDTTSDTTSDDIGETDTGECRGGLERCASRCIDTDSTIDHCGGCNQRCRPPANSVTDACEEGDCVYECEEGYFDLNDNLDDPLADGCEADCMPTNGGVEACDDIDNNCDGSVDEGCDCTAGDTRDCGTNEGACNAGTQDCNSGGTWGACQGVDGPEAEVCDGVDNDCDGQTDENIERACGTDQGTCSEGVESCSNGSWGSCSGEVGPSRESCDSQDNDCDGQVDEDFAELGTSCQAGTGACERTGTFTCNSSGTGVNCNATPGAPSTETCDGVDNDCDGQVDENLTQTCGTNEGACSTGTETCSGGQWGQCQGATEPTTETCDGIDNDCDGQTDEGVTKYYYDEDGDGYGTSDYRCTSSGNYTATQSGDCDDENEYAYPGADNLYCADTVDYDCDGVVGCEEDICNDGDACVTENNGDFLFGNCSGNTCIP